MRGDGIASAAAPRASAGGRRDEWNASTGLLEIDELLAAPGAPPDEMELEVDRGEPGAEADVGGPCGRLPPARRRASSEGLPELADGLAWLGIRAEGVEAELADLHSALGRLEAQLAADAQRGAETARLLDALELRLGRLEGALESSSARTRERLETTLRRSHSRLVLLASAALVALGALLLRS